MLEIVVGIAIVIAFLYLLLIMPRVWSRPESRVLENIDFAHRGLHNNESTAPENSLPAFQLAVDRGYGIEMDIQLSKDKVPVVFHDYTLNRMCGVDKRVDELTLQELKELRLAHSNEKIPTLQEALDTIKGKTPIIVEYKIERSDLSLCEKAIPILDRYKGYYCMESFHPFALRWFKKYRPKIIRGQLASHFKRDKEEGNHIIYFLLSRLLCNFLGRPDFIAYRYKYPYMLSLMLCKKLYGIKTAAWTVKSQTDFESSIKHFDYIIFDSFIPQK